VLSTLFQIETAQNHLILPIVPSGSALSQIVRMNQWKPRGNVYWDWITSL